MTVMPAFSHWRARIDLSRLSGALKWPRETGPARIVQALPVGPGTRLLVVEFGGRQVLIGQARGVLVRLADTAPLALPPVGAAP